MFSFFMEYFFIIFFIVLICIIDYKGIVGIREDVNRSYVCNDVRNLIEY